MKRKLLRTFLVAILLIAAGCTKDADNIGIKQGEISAIAPTTGPGDTEVTITIDGLSALTDPTVFFNDTEAVVMEVTNTTIKAIVPRRAMTGAVKVIANGQTITGPEFEYIITPGQVTTLTGAVVGSDVLEGPIADVAWATTGMTISIDPEGNLYTSELGGKRIRKIDTDLMVTTLINKGSPAQAVFSNSFSIVSNGNLISCNSTEHTIEEISLTDGTINVLAGTGASGNVNGSGNVAQFSTPTGIGIDNNNNIYISDAFNHSIRKISMTNEVTTFAGTGETGFADGSATSAQFAIPEGLAISSDGSIFVSDFRNHSIRKIAIDGTVSTFAGTGEVGFNDGPGTAAQFNFPSGITINSEDDLFVTDAGNHRIRKITQDGVVSTYAGTGTAGTTDGFLTEASFDFIGEGIFVSGGITIDGNDVLYVTPLGGLIRKVTPEF